MSSAIRVMLGAPSATRALGGAIAEVLEGGDVVLLVGELGAGKTTLTKGLVGALGVTDEVTSPTFTLLHLYPSEPPVAHVDCWRLDSLEEVADLGLDEILDDGGVAVIEWGELAAPLLGRDALTVSIDVFDDESAGAAGDDAPRLAILAPQGAQWPERLRHLLQACVNAGLAAELLADGANSEAGTRR